MADSVGVRLRIWLPYEMLVDCTETFDPIRVVRGDCAFVVHRPSSFEHGVTMDGSPLRERPSVERVRAEWREPDQPVTRKVTGDDVLLVDVYREIAAADCDPDGRLKRGVIDAMQVPALEFALEFLSYTRWRTGQADLVPHGVGGRTQWSVLPPDGSEVPVGLGFRVDLAGPTTLSSALTRDHWQQIAQDLDARCEIDLVDVYLLDAEAVVHREPRRAVLDAAIAAEVFIESYVAGRAGNPAGQLCDYLRVPVKVWYDKILECVTGHSLRKSQPALWTDLDYLFRARNCIAHEGRCEYNDEANKRVKVDATEAARLIAQCRRAIHWVRELV